MQVATGQPTIEIDSLGPRKELATVQRTAGNDLIYAKRTRDGRLFGLRVADCFVPVASGHVRGYIGESLEELDLKTGDTIELVFDDSDMARSAILAAPASRG